MGGGENMSYKKPTIVAQNKSAGSYAAGCPEHFYGTDVDCRRCDRAR